MRASAIVFCGALGGLILVGWLPFDGFWVQASWAALLVCIGLSAVAAMGGGTETLLATFAGRVEPRDLALGAGLGAASFAVSWFYVTRMNALLDVEIAHEVQLLDVVWIVVLPPLLEEWLCRGVLWRALEPYTDEKARIPTTAALFALMHFLEAAFISIPHRFVGGLLLGWLRQRSGSLVPGIVGHAVWNALGLCTDYLGV